MSKLAVDERACQLLKALVERHIRDGLPVGSKTLEREGKWSISSATIRTVLADLEHQGLLVSPHTSAGRIPTPAAYRLFVDRLLDIQPLALEQQRALNGCLRPELSRDQLLRAASDRLADIAELTVLVTSPRLPDMSLRQLQLLPLPRERVLAILVCDDQVVSQSIWPLPMSTAEDQLSRLEAWVNRQFRGWPCSRIHAALAEMQWAEPSWQPLFKQLLIPLLAMPDAHDNSIWVTGQEYLLAGDDEAHSGDAHCGDIRQLLGLLRRPLALSPLFHSVLDSERVRCYIGESSLAPVLSRYSLVLAPYRVNTQCAGVIGVIGPVRMAYDSVIAAVQAAAQGVSTALSD